MLAQQQGLSDADARSREPFLATITGFLLLATLLYVLKLSYKPDLDRWVLRSEEYLARAQEMRERKDPPSEDERNKFAGELNRFLDDYDRWWRNDTRNYPSGGHPLAGAIRDTQFYAIKREGPEEDPRIELADLSEVEKFLKELHTAGVEMRNSPLLGNSRPTSDAARTSLSEFSGPRSSRRVFAEENRDRAGQLVVDPPELRQDGLGRPMMPARNTAYLGRSLFSDYLLPVELAGMLLLVATIGAIAIAQRRGSSATAGTGSSQERTT
ncbi:MAG: NADH-quinone oxidoreductase subunit J [Planctomycetes bacterium]|nr:NADH-quinone oxidoreductase subunit J [Planctomycetota bacterium]